MRLHCIHTKVIQACSTRIVRLRNAVNELIERLRSSHPVSWMRKEHIAQVDGRSCESCCATRGREG